MNFACLRMMTGRMDPLGIAVLACAKHTGRSWLGLPSSIQWSRNMSRIGVNTGCRTQASQTAAVVAVVAVNQAMPLAALLVVSRTYLKSIVDNL